MPSRVHVVFIIAVWWAASSLTSITSKEAMTTHSDAGVNVAFRDMRWLELTALQLLLGTIVSVTLTRGDHKTSTPAGRTRPGDYTFQPFLDI